ncbi:MAG: hypothetical protein ACT4OL_05985 [Nitrospiraceae bacterium]
MKVLAFAWDRYAAGLATNIEVASAHHGCLRTRDNQIDALFRFNGSRINLARAKGEFDKIS